MNKTLLITLEYPPQKGGVARYLHNMYSGRSHDDLVVLAPHAKNENVFDKGEPYKIYRRKMSVWWAWPRWRIIGWHVISIWFRERFREIHISHVLPVGYIALVFWKIFKIPYVVYAHGMDILLPQKLPWKKFWLKIILRNAREVIANSNFTKNKILELGIGVGKIDVRYPCVRLPISNSRLSAEYAGATPVLEHYAFSAGQAGPNGSDVRRSAAGREADEWVNGIKKQYNLEYKKIILSVGRLVPRKGFDKIIEAMPKILLEIPNTVCVIVGSGPDKDRLCQMSNVKCQMSIIYVDNASEQELYAWYEACDLFAMPARQIGGDVEGFGIVFLEAALHGKPSIGGRSGGIPEAIEDGKTGILVDPDSIDEIAETLIKLLKDDNLRAELGQAAKARVEGKFICVKESHNLPWR